MSVSLSIYQYVLVYICVYVYMYVCMHNCISVYFYLSIYLSVFNFIQVSHQSICQLGWEAHIGEPTNIPLNGLYAGLHSTHKTPIFRHGCKRARTPVLKLITGFCAAMPIFGPIISSNDNIILLYVANSIDLSACNISKF